MNMRHTNIMLLLMLRRFRHIIVDRIAELRPRRNDTKPHIHYLVQAARAKYSKHLLLSFSLLPGTMIIPLYVSNHTSFISASKML